MKGFRFYAEMPKSRGSKSACKRYAAFTRLRLANAGQPCNVLAVIKENRRPGLQMSDAFGEVDACSGGIGGHWLSNDYLRKRCVRVSETLARHLHPRLFRYLERPTP